MTIKIKSSHPGGTAKAGGATAKSLSENDLMKMMGSEDVD
jgi:hypothetical protein